MTHIPESLILDTFKFDRPIASCEKCGWVIFASGKHHGWAAIVLETKSRTGIRLAGYLHEDVGNSVALVGILKALEFIPKGLASSVTVFTDHKFLVDGMNNWVKNWMADQWKTINKKPAACQDIVQSICELVRPHRVRWQHRCLSESEYGGSINDMVRQMSAAALAAPVESAPLIPVNAVGSIVPTPTEFIPIHPIVNTQTLLAKVSSPMHRVSFNINPLHGVSGSEQFQRIIFTDGSCLNNPGPGGWAAILLNFERMAGLGLAGGEEGTTNNRMELMAVIQGLRAIQPNVKTLVVLDSKYVKQGYEEYLPRWIQNGWRTSTKEPVKNQDLWEILHAIASNSQIEWRYVKGHAGSYYNEMADKLAQQMSKSISSKK